MRWLAEAVKGEASWMIADGIVYYLYLFDGMLPSFLWDNAKNRVLKNDGREKLQLYSTDYHFPGFLRKRRFGAAKD
jgi:hypothetical protein